MDPCQRMCHFLLYIFHCQRDIYIMSVSYAADAAAEPEPCSRMATHHANASECPRGESYRSVAGPLQIDRYLECTVVDEWIN